MSKLPGIAILALMFVLGIPSAASVADALSDCQQKRQLRLEACTVIIDGASYPLDQKAIAYRYRGNARADSGALTMALADLNEAIRLNPSDAQAHVLRGLVRVRRSDVAGAIADYSEAIRLESRSAIAFNGRGHAYLVKGDASLAIDDFTQALALSPKSASTLNIRGLAHRKLGHVDRAVEDYTAAIALNPIYALAYSNRGHALAAQGRKDEAIADWRRALLLDPSLADARKGLSRLGSARQLESEIQQLVRDGRSLVETHCSRCHAVGLKGSSPNAKAPEFRSLSSRHPMLDLREPLTRGIAAPHDEMPRFSMNDAEIDSIVTYINSLPVPGKK